LTCRIVARGAIIPFVPVLDKPKHFFNGIVIEIVALMNGLLSPQGKPVSGVNALQKKPDPNNRKIKKNFTSALKKLKDL
jgi:hypothetical protein